MSQPPETARTGEPWLRDVDVDDDENERDAVKYDERGRRILADDIVAAIHQAHARGLTAPMLPPKRQIRF